jgi:hypothetical protein
MKTMYNLYKIISLYFLFCYRNSLYTKCLHYKHLINFLIKLLSKQKTNENTSKFETLKTKDRHDAQPAFHIFEMPCYILFIILACNLEYGILLN